MLTLLALLTVHCVADFLLQSDWMAINKSKNWEALGQHVTVYAVTFHIVLFVGYGWWLATQFAVLTFAAHFVQDAITSRVTSKLWFQNKRHWFFVTIGFDQLIHAWQLGLTWMWLYGG